MTTRTPFRALLVLPAGVALLTGLATGLALLGLPSPVPAARVQDAHGLLMVLGFVGTLVTLERAVAVRRPVAYLAPATLGLGALALLSPAPRAVGQGLLVAGTLGLVAIYAVVWRRQPAVATAIQAAGAVLAVGGAALWAAGLAVPDLLPWLVGFVAWTVLGERVELARLEIDARTERTVLAGALVYLGAACLALLAPAPGYAVAGAALAASAVTLLRHDVARRTVRGRGLPRFAAAAMLAGYAWLVLAGAAWVFLAAGAGPTGLGPAVTLRSGTTYDAVVHAVFLGFGLSMIMAHAPLILPAVLRRPLPYRAAMWAPLVLLHASLAVRVTGDLAGDGPGVVAAVRVGGVGNVVAVLAFVGVALWSALLRDQSSTSRDPASTSRDQPAASRDQGSTSADRASASRDRGSPSAPSAVLPIVSGR
ncbi:hypothetical protein [Cellulosimicrobium cellulans]|uniref:hypothetical protein n=1 Tax=Cellulosimicrobium cellulans TaxID=1710 RepID=UPI0020CD08D9|nr:hypothetical protein NMQ07_06785 [Cellulosimicrobium cellulans]